jgi:hypothetical protein
MRSDFDILHDLVAMMLAIVELADPPLHRLLSRLSIPPFFCISWLLTWFSHDILHLPDLRRLFDFFIANEPVAIVYAAAVVPMLARKELLDETVEGAEMHQTLKELPKKTRSSLLILHTARLMREYPIESLKFKTPKSIAKYPCIVF